eukprot:2969982-Lingulodinium_polyedra.AAC.1
MLALQERLGETSAPALRAFGLGSGRPARGARAVSAARSVLGGVAVSKAGFRRVGAAGRVRTFGHLRAAQ